ncbi:hypothetical protein KKA27_04135 [Patescibacteria group bacterium]|nr:hypothetical protein [Patescibacteria group bacterium]MBU2633293.1 hypothetical protein [Patescibacteria group bacterium]
MSLIEFIRNVPIEIGWTDIGRNAYAQVKEGRIKINVPLFLAEAIIHEYVHCTNPNAELGNEYCSGYIQKRAKQMMNKLSESALKEIADEVLKAIQRGGNYETKGD